jgi:hypothetical protein
MILKTLPPKSGENIGFLLKELLVFAKIGP